MGGFFVEFDVFEEDFSEKLDKYVGQKIKMYRQKKKMSQKELGKLIGVGDSAISAYELGKNSLTLSIIFKIAKILDVKVNDLFPDVDQGTDELMEEIKSWEDNDRNALLNFARTFKVSR